MGIRTLPRWICYHGCRTVSSLGVLLRPLLSCGDGLCLILLPRLGNVVGERIVWVGCAEQSLDGEEDGADLQGRRPVA